MTNKEYNEAFQAGYDQAMQELENRHYLEARRHADEDPTGQDLDDFIERYHSEPDNYDHVECPTQRAELRFGA